MATGGRLFVEAAGSIIRIDPMTDERKVIATGSLLDARDGKIVVRSCASDLTCPIYVLDSNGRDWSPAAHLVGDDIGLSPDGGTLVSGARSPTQASVLALVDVESGQLLPVDADALRFVSTPFAWSPDGAWMVGATAARTLVAVRVADGTVHRIELPEVERSISGLLVRPTARD